MKNEELHLTNFLKETNKEEEIDHIVVNVIMATKYSLHIDLKTIKDLVYDKSGIALTNLKLNTECVEYGACSFEINGRKVEHRVSKITPTKPGQFVTIWKRNKNGITAPFDISDNIDFLIVTSKSQDNIGQFIFPKSILVDKGIFSQDGKIGKRGIRVYPSWDTTINKQAAKTQNWQTKYFIQIMSANAVDLDFAVNFFEQLNINLDKCNTPYCR